MTFPGKPLWVAHRQLPPIVDRLLQEDLLNIHWDKLAIQFTLKFSWGHVKRGRFHSDLEPVLTLIEARILRNRELLLVRAFTVPSNGELFHPLGSWR